MSRCKKHRGGSGGPLPLICVAFGAGIILALFFSLKLVVVLAAIFLIALGLLAAER